MRHACRAHCRKPCNARSKISTSAAPKPRCASGRPPTRTDRSPSVWQDHHAVPPLLCVDDESSNLATLRQLLRDDFALVFAKSGGEALDAVSRHAPKLILLDVELPDMDGYAVARALKQQPSSNAIPILFVTSRNSEHDERLGLEAGAADYVSKPYSPALLKARIGTQLKLAENARLAQQYREAIHLLGTAGRARTPTPARISGAWRCMRVSWPRRWAGRRSRRRLCRTLPVARRRQDRSARQHPAKARFAGRTRTLGGAPAPQAGHDLLRHGRGPVFQLAAEIALHHHECWDGSGYPQGLSGEAIPESARIVAVADVFDALCGRRAYKAPWTVEDALRKLDSMAGKQLEPRLVQHFHDALPQILQIKDAWDSPAA